MKEESAAKIVSEHIKQFMFKTPTRKKLTQQEAADALGISVATLKRYIACETIPSENYAKAMETATGIIYPYWMGETECKTWIEYYTEIEKCESEGMEKYDREIEQRQIMFYNCGYRYELLHDAVHDFAECGSDSDSTIIYQSYHPHQLTSFQEPDKHYYFNQEELDALINQLKDTIAFACFKKERATQQKERQQDGNGNTGM